MHAMHALLTIPAVQPNPPHSAIFTNTHVAARPYRRCVYSAAHGRRGGLQGDCSEDPLGSLPVPRRPGQCLVTVREDFLEANPGPDSLVWLSGLYVYTLGLIDKNQGTVLASHTDLFLTDMTLVAQGHKARGIEVQENQTVFMAGAHSSSVCGSVWCFSRQRGESF